MNKIRANHIMTLTACIAINLCVPIVIIITQMTYYAESCLDCIGASRMEFPCFKKLLALGAMAFTLATLSISDTGRPWDGLRSTYWALQSFCRALVKGRTYTMYALMHHTEDEETEFMYTQPRLMFELARGSIISGVLTGVTVYSVFWYSNLLLASMLAVVLVVTTLGNYMSLVSKFDRMADPLAYDCLLDGGALWTLVTTSIVCGMWLSYEPLFSWAAQPALINDRLVSITRFAFSLGALVGGAFSGTASISCYLNRHRRYQRAAEYHDD